MQCTDQLKCLCIPLNLGTIICRNKQTTLPLVRAPVQKTAVPASPRSVEELAESAFRTRMQLFLLVSALQSGSQTYESPSFRLHWSFYLVTTNVGIPGRRVVRRQQRGIVISFCAVVLKLRCVLLIAQTRNDMETDIPVCTNTKYGYLNSDRYLQWRMINSNIY